MADNICRTQNPPIKVSCQTKLHFQFNRMLRLSKSRPVNLENQFRSNGKLLQTETSQNKISIVVFVEKNISIPGTSRNLKNGH